ncbi:hypothetical protein CPC08DRAFT_769031 [Agrocybe pediades]|nr:hypothetical protein CPC08DRAFT_769031 [Agrocybe pediades]
MAPRATLCRRNGTSATASCTPSREEAAKEFNMGSLLQILESLVGEKCCDLEAFVARCCKKYSIDSLAQAITIHSSQPVASYYTENMGLIELPNEVETEKSCSGPANTDETIERPKKRPEKGRGRGRISQEDDF